MKMMRTPYRVLVFICFYRFVDYFVITKTSEIYEDYPRY